MQVAKVTIQTDQVLAETISDYLIGMLNAAVEYRIDGAQKQFALCAFVISEQWLESELTDLVTSLQTFGDEMAEIFQVNRPSIAFEVLQDQDWSATWKAYFKPFAILDDLIISPTWEPYKPAPGEVVIVMDPGMAFGTGHHATTKLCLALIRSEQKAFCGRSLLDVGTGTGILGMAAALWGAGSVFGIDNDREAVNAAQKNVERNGLAETVTCSATSLAEVRGTFSLVVANIVHDVLLELAEDLARVTSEGGILILSGLIRGGQTITITNCFSKHGFLLIQELEEGEWSALKLKKKH